MKRYYKRDAESDLGQGVAYIEITDGRPSRQVEIYGEHYRFGDVEHNEFLADQPFEALDLNSEHEIEVSEFDRVWSQAQKRCLQSK